MLMNDDKSIMIRWGTGSMIINLQEFFPTSAARINQLLKIIGLDWQNGQQLIVDILEYLREAVVNYKDMKSSVALVWSNEHQAACDYTSMVNSRKKPSGVMLTKDELEEARSNRDYYKKQASAHKKEILDYQRKIDKIPKNIELIERKTGLMKKYG